MRSGALSSNLIHLMELKPVSMRSGLTHSFFPNAAEEKILYLTPEQEKDKSHFTDKEVCDWFGDTHKET